MTAYINSACIEGCDHLGPGTGLVLCLIGTVSAVLFYCHFFLWQLSAPQYIPSYATTLGFSRIDGTIALSVYNLASVVGKRVFAWVARNLFG